jgi:hypothetical protein
VNLDEDLLEPAPALEAVRGIKDYWEVSSTLSLASYAQVQPSIPTCTYSGPEAVACGSRSENKP